MAMVAAKTERAATMTVKMTAAATIELVVVTATKVKC